MRLREPQRPSREITQSSAFTPLKEEDLQPRWESLSRELEQKKENLEDLIKKSGVSVIMMKFKK